jgi:ParB family transcriptional regulator, chromosome partitioning protein
VADEIPARNRVSAPRPATVPTDSLRPNPHNPRMLFDKLPLKTLEDSIRKVGVLVPLTVYRASGSEHYTILDGQRRWICAKNIGLSNVPINEVAEPSIAENIVTMFQIHKLRKDWELMPTALKLGVLMDALKERREKQLAELTGLDVAVVTRCKKLLTFPEEFQNMMLFADPKDRIKADFFIELYPIITDRIIMKADWFHRDELTRRFLYKYQNKLSEFKSITDFRKIKQYITSARNSGHEKLLLRRFKAMLDDDKVGISSLDIGPSKIHRQAQQIKKSVEKLVLELRDLEVSEYVGEEELWGVIEDLSQIVRRLLERADRRSV